MLKPRPDREIDGKTATCRRCGTCCRNGGPALHWQDYASVKEGKIALKYLYTIRKGEVLRDNVNGGLIKTGTEIIKIKGRESSWTCIFLEETNSNACRVYSCRPLECRVLKCWDTAELEAVYAKQRLTRKDLLAQIEGLWDLVVDHEGRCAYRRLRQYTYQLTQGSREAESIAAILDMISFDRQLRRVMAEKAGLDLEIMDFALGRPLTQTLPQFDLRLVKIDGKIYIEYQGQQYATKPS